MMDTQLLQQRILAAQSYYEALERSFEHPWLEQHEALLVGQLPLAEAMTLLHPQHYEARERTEHLRGPRAFSEQVGTGGLRCAGVQVWGYECPNTDLVADHWFPYGLGGPTISSNKLLLCRAHNTGKSSDVHFYVWERGEPEWLRVTLEKIAGVLRRS